ncbi:hypothetical protein CXG81DRAFT_4964, partial [Caulochytrium protostelioides]
ENRRAIAATAAALVTVSMGFPLDSIKVRTQAYYYPSMAACIRQTYAQEGVAGFFRGIGPPLLTVSSMKTIAFSVYADAREFCHARLHFARDVNSHLGASAFLGGAVSGVATSFIAAPFEFVKIQRILATRMTETTTTASASAANITLALGIFGVWRGLSIHLVRDFFGCGLYFSAYEAVKRVAVVAPVTHPWVHVLGGALCGFTSWLVIFPVDSVCTQYRKRVL